MKSTLVWGNNLCYPTSIDIQTYMMLNVNYKLPPPIIYIS